MGIRRRQGPSEVPGWDAEIYARASRRLSRLQTHELLSWADAAGSGMSRAFGDHRLDGNLESLEEIRTALITLWALTQDLEVRARAQLDQQGYRV